MVLKDYYFKLSTEQGDGTVSGTIKIATNGNYSVGSYAYADVKVPQGKPIEVTSAAAMEAALVEENIGKVYLYLGPTDENFIQGEYYQVAEDGN